MAASSSSQPSEEISMDYLQLWLSGVLSDEAVHQRMGQAGLDWYRLLKGEMEAMDVEGVAPNGNNPE